MKNSACNSLLHVGSGYLLPCEVVDQTLEMLSSRRRMLSKDSLSNNQTRRYVTSRCL